MKGDRISADLAKSDVFATITFKACIVSYLCHYEAENYEFFVNGLLQEYHFRKCALLDRDILIRQMLPIKINCCFRMKYLDIWQFQI